MILRGATSLLGALEVVGPDRECHLGPKKSNAPHNDDAPLKIIKYRAIKTTGTLIVINNLSPKNFLQPDLAAVKFFCAASYESVRGTEPYTLYKNVVL
jgi:hypothetical protein